jgi:glyoxylase-like metal-dependent hydrolase (beta-lactamase superfamily II)
MLTLKKKIFEAVEVYKFGSSPIGKPAMTVCCFYIDALLIDTAQHNARKKVLKTFENKKIEQIALTHWHEDHIGNTADLYLQHQATVFAHPFTAQKLHSGFKVLPYEQFMFGKIKPYLIPTQPFPEKIITENFEFLPIYTPGHSEDHTVFLEPHQGWLFAGDLFVSTKIKYFRRGEDLGEQIESIKRVLQEDFDVIFCGHFPQFKNGKELFKKKLQYFEDFYGSVKYYHQQGYDSKAIMKAMKLKEIHWLKYATFFDVSVELMVQSVIDRENRLRMA